MTAEAFRDRGWHETAPVVYVRPDWHADALCRGTMRDGVSDWFGPQHETEREKHQRLQRVRATCLRCPAFDACEQAGRGERNGLWAGSGYAAKQRAS